MTDRLSEERLQHLIDFTSATSSEANSILFELKSLRLLVAELKVDAENLSRALSMHDLEYGDIRIIGKHRSLMSKVDEVTGN